jgi:hypothetical protein
MKMTKTRFTLMTALIFVVAATSAAGSESAASNADQLFDRGSTLTEAPKSSPAQDDAARAASRSDEDEDC